MFLRFGLPAARVRVAGGDRRTALGTTATRRKTGGEPEIFPLWKVGRWVEGVVVKISRRVYTNINIYTYLNVHRVFNSYGKKKQIFSLSISNFPKIKLILHDTRSPD